MKRIIFSKIGFQEGLKSKPLFWYLACMMLVFNFLLPKTVDAQCKKSTSTCNLTTITNAFTPTATYLGCGDDSCSLYYLLPNAITADSAENWANSLGAHLTSIHSKAENDSIVKWAAAAGVTGSVWIGFNDKANDSNFVWTDGSDSTYSNWKANRPNGINANDDCVQLYVTGADSGSWNDTACTLVLPAIVKVSLCMTLTLEDDTVCLGDTGMVVANPMMGSSPYTFVWSTTSTNDTLTLAPLGTTSVRVTVTDQYNCTVEDTAVIHVDTLPSIDLGGPDTICNNQFRVLDAGAGFTYLWSSGKTNQTDTVIFAGEHWGRITDANGCSSTDTFQLVTDTIPVFNIGNDSTVCDGDTVTVTPNNIKGTYAYVWHDASTGTSFKTDTTETITLTVTDSNGCSSTETKEIRLALNPVISLANDSAVCDSFIFTIDGPFGFNYHEWRVSLDTTFGPTVTVNQPGTYYYYGRDTNECPAYDTVLINWNPKPVIDLGNDTAICQFDTLMLSVDTIYTSIFWSTGDTVAFVKVTNPTTYSVIVKDTNGCEGSDFIAIANDTLPVVEVMRNGFPGDTSFCMNDSIFLHNATTDTSMEYQWNSGGFVKGNDTLIAKTAGTYVLTLRDTNTCVNSDSIVLTVDTLPTVNLTTDTTFCVGDSIMLTSNPDTNYHHVWGGINLGKQDTLWIKDDSTYVLELIDRNTTCRNLDSVVISHDTLPVINLGVDTGFCENDTITLDAGANYRTYTWTVPAGHTGSTNTQTIRVSTAGAYTVNVVDSNLCKGQDSRVVSKYLLPLPNLGPDKQFCAGTPVNEVLDPGAGYSYYVWDSGRQGDSTLARRDTATTQGLHWVLVTDSNGCQNSDSILINASFLPTVNLGADTMFCEGDKFNLLVDAGPGFVKYEWFEAKSGIEVLLPTTGQILLVKDSSSHVVVRITDGNGCTNKDSMRVIVNNNPVVPFNVSKYCESNRRFFSEELNAGFGFASYEWSTGETTQRITVTEAGEYTVTVTDGATGCEGGGTKTVVEIPQPNIDWTADSILCKGTTVTLDAGKTGYVHYWWTQVFEDGSVDTLNPFLPLIPPDTIPDIDSTITSMEIDTPGTYMVYTRYFEAPFCFDSAMTTIREDIFPVIDFGITAPDTTLCVGETLRLSPNFSGSSSKLISYNWQDGNTDSVYNARTTGLYSLVLRNDCGADIDEVYITFDDCSNIYIPNTFTPNGDGDNDYWSIVSLQRFIEFELQIFDRNGHVIWESSDPDVFWDGTHMKTGEELPNGMYVYRISYRSEFEFIDGVNSAPTRELQGALHILR